MIQYIARSANHPLTLWPWGKDMSAARVQSNSKYYPRDWFDKWMWKYWENYGRNWFQFYQKIEIIWNTISQTFQGQCLQNCCKFCLKCANSVLQSDVVLIFIATVPLSDALLCVIQPLLNIYQIDPICCPTLLAEEDEVCSNTPEMLLTIGTMLGDFVRSRHPQTGSRRSRDMLTLASDEVNINRQ